MQMLSLKTFALGAATALALAATPASAALVTTWNYTLTDEFTAATNTANDDSAAGWFESATEISWGSPTQRSSLTISPADGTVNGVVNTNSGIAVGPTLTHNNTAIPAQYATLSSATLLSTLYLTAAVPAGPAADPIAVNFDISFIETLNEAPCSDPQGPDCADIFVLSNPGSLTQFIDYGGMTYKITIFELTGAIKVLNESDCLAVGQGAGCIGFVTSEGEATSAQFGFIIQAPEPAAFALFGAGLAGLGLAARRRRK
ncbi:THxN family PEP-CTERM protein [Parapedomonas caeni]